MSYSSFYQYDTGPTQLEKDFVEAVTFNNLAILQQLFDNIENEDDQEFVDGLNFQMIPAPKENIIFPDLPYQELHLLHIAAYFDSIECFIFLCSKGFQMNILSMRAFMPLHYACAGGSLEVFTYILSKMSAKTQQELNYVPHDSFSSPVFLATSSKSHAILKLLFENGATIPKKLSFGNDQTALIMSIKNRDFESFCILLEHCNIEQNGEKDYSPIMKAVCVNSKEGIQLLLDYGADINYHTPDYKTALYVACFIKNVEMVRFLLDNGAYVNQRGYLGKFPIHYAAMSDNLLILKLIIEAGANPKATDLSGKPATFSALCSNKYRYPIMKILLDCGVDPNAIDEDTNSIILSPLLLNPDPNGDDLLLINLILEKGGDLNFVTNSGFTLYKLVTVCSHPKIQEIVNNFLKNHPEIELI